jgi:hypothetical protein
MGINSTELFHAAEQIQEAVTATNRLANVTGDKALRDLRRPAVDTDCMSPSELRRLTLDAKHRGLPGLSGQSLTQGG